MATGYEDTEFRKNIVQLVNRKNGDGELRTVTRAQDLYFARFAAVLHTIPQVTAPRIQNDDGSFPYLPGMDGPVTS
jgi:hypothetical protein